MAGPHCYHHCPTAIRAGGPLLSPRRNIIFTALVFGVSPRPASPSLCPHVDDRRRAKHPLTSRMASAICWGTVGGWQAR